MSFMSSPENISPAPRLLNADVIRVAAMVMVIFLHTILNFTIRTDFFATKLWFLLEPVVAVSKTCVLLFFMLSGYLVISKNRTIKTNLDKTLRKILLPLGFFTLVNIVYNWSKFASDGTWSEFVLNELHRMTRFPSSPLWFLVVLAFLYLLNPVWGLIFARNQKPDVARFITFSALLFSLMITLVEFPAQRTGQIFTSFTGWTGFVFFYLYGGLIKNGWIKSSQQRLNLLMIGLGWVLTMAGDFLTMWQRVHGISFIWNDYTGNYLSIPVTMMAVGIFNWLIHLDLSKFRWPILNWLAGLSFGIYLIHTYVIALLGELGFRFDNLQLNVYFYNALNVILVFGISLVLTLLIKKIPRLRVLIGD